MLVFDQTKTISIYAVDVSEARAPVLHSTVEPQQLHELDVGAPHTMHCLADGHVMVSTMGDAEGRAKGHFVLLDGDTFAVKGTWSDQVRRLPFGR